MRIVRALAAVGAVVAGSLLLGVPEAGAAGPVITVVPSTLLTDGQSVTVTGTGFTVPTTDMALYLGECAAGVFPLTFNDCDNGTIVSLSESTNDFVESLTVKHIITTSDQGALDCAVANTCVVGAAEVESATSEIQEATAPISFLSLTPPPPLPPHFRIITARLVGHVPPGGPVELGVLAQNESPTPTTWSISQSSDVGLTAVNAICPFGRAQGATTCDYAPAGLGVGQLGLALFRLEASPGFAGIASAMVCATALNSPVGVVPAQTCETVTTTVG